MPWSATSGPASWPGRTDGAALAIADQAIADRYEVGELIGRGGMAEVFAGTDRRLDRPVAVKLLLPAMAARPDIRTRFEAEARAAASLSHPNAVAVFDTGEHDGVPYIVMERLPGETLADRMGAGPVDPAWLTTVAAEVLGALGAAHAAGLVHRDVKPANILLAADGRAKVADFGIAKSLEPDSAAAGDLTLSGQVLGTPAYLAPELLAGAAASPRSDLWALGVTLYEALAGSKPFAGTTAADTARLVAAGEYRPLAHLRPGLDPGLVAVVERALALDPGERFASAAEMAEALTSQALTSPVAVAPTLVAPTPADGTRVLGTDELAPPPTAAPAPAAARSGARRQRVLIGGIAALVVLVLVVVVARSASNDRSPTSVAGGRSTTAARAASTVPTTLGAASALARRLRDAAARLDSSGGSSAADLASRLRAMADRVESGAGTSDATGLLTTTLALARTGRLSPDAVATVVGVLASVPGIDPSIVDALSALVAPTTAVPTTAAPAPAPAPTKAPGKAKKGKD